MSSPLYLPEGSIRAIIVLMLMISACLYTGLGIEISKDLWTIIHLAIGFYFGQKIAKGGDK